MFHPLCIKRTLPTWIALVFALLHRSADASIRYISVSGSDTADGTSIHPWHTLIDRRWAE